MIEHAAIAQAMWSRETAIEDQPPDQRSFGQALASVLGVIEHTDDFDSIAALEMDRAERKADHWRSGLEHYDDSTRYVGVGFLQGVIFAVAVLEELGRLDGT